MWMVSDGRVRRPPFLPRYCPPDLQSRSAHSRMEALLLWSDAALLRLAQTESGRYPWMPARDTHSDPHAYRILGDYFWDSPPDRPASSCRQISLDGRLQQPSIHQRGLGRGNPLE